jgi:transcriptional pleiotropic regulator of transition state genes
LKSTGVVRKIDELGRIVLPSEIRKVFAIHEGDQLEISVDGEKIVLEKRRDVCTFCSAENPQIEFKGRKVCERCAKELSQSKGKEIRIPDAEIVQS